MRLDFRWLVAGRSIDHTTLSEFRRKNADALKNTFVQIGLLARELGWLRLNALAFVYDEPEDCYWCPQGQRLPYAGTTRAQKRNRVRERRRYQSSPDDCTKCPLLAMCVQSQAKSRTINREQHESLRESHAVKMATDEAQEKYSRRRHPGARPFVVIEQHFGAGRFLLRGLDRVKQEWHWLASAFNLDRLFGLMRGGTGPPGVPT